MPYSIGSISSNEKRYCFHVLTIPLPIHIYTPSSCQITKDFYRNNYHSNYLPHGHSGSSIAPASIQTYIIACLESIAVHTKHI